MMFLGVPDVRLGAQSLRFRSRKTVALLAYLALESGPQARDRLASMLWPDVDEASARASLRTALSQVNAELGSQRDLVHSSRAAVGFTSDDVQLDVHQLERAFRAASESGATPELETELETAVSLCRGELLEGLSLNDAPDFDDWLIAHREIARGWLDGVLERLCALYLESGNAKRALEVAQRRVRLEPLNESAHRSLIELHVGSGNRTAALEAYRACKAILEAELGLEPSAQTEALLGNLAFSLDGLPDLAIPRAVEGSSRLVGRERERAAMEAAWQVGQHIFIAGEPGAGKTRLIFEFAATKGAFAQQFGRPGDQAVPFSSITRGIRHALQAYPDLDLPDWARRELSRLIPELSDEALAPLSSREDRLRLFDATSCLFEALRNRGLYSLGDDFQFVDDSSMELIAYMMTDGPSGFPLGSLSAFRPEEISIGFKEIVRRMVEAGNAILIKLEPLHAEEVGEMLTDLIPEGVNRDQLGSALHRFTGGNPLFVLETVRSLAERGGLETLTAERFENRRRLAGLPRTPKVQTIIQRRLEQLSTPARDLARVAAVAGEHFTLELGAKVLETPILELVRCCEELEAARIWHGLRFNHDLLFETTLEGIPESLRSVLHGRVLDGLEGSNVPAAILARHAFGAHRWKEAFRHSVEAAAFAEEAYW